MDNVIETLEVYLQLARASQRRRRPYVSDRLLVLAGVVAARGGLSQVADCCRQAILQHNPHHVVGRWPTFEAGLCQEDFLSLLHQIERRYPLEKAEQMLDALGIVPSQQRQKYATVEQYLAALLGVTPERLEGF